MTRLELLALIANGENSGVEFKGDQERPERLAKEIVALANFRGGKLVLGVEDDGTVTGIRRSDLEQWVMDAVFGRKVHPMILPFYEEVRMDDDRRVAVITVTQGIAKPYVVRHNNREEIYIRVGSTSQHASREQQARLFALGGLLHAELLPVSGSGFGDLSRERLEDYLTAIVGDGEAPSTEARWHERLCGLGFLTEREDGPPVCTIAGLVLFGRKPRRLLRQAGVRWMAFDGDDKAYRALDDTVVDGPLVALFAGRDGAGRQLLEEGLIERLEAAMRPFLSTEADTVNAPMRRERLWHYAKEAVREAVVNALAHRDWTRNEEIEVARYANRLVATSPGALPNTMTVAKMIAGQRSARNPLIVEVLRDYAYADARGMGVRKKILPLARQSSGRAPEFDATEDHLRLTMWKGAGCA